MRSAVGGQHFGVDRSGPRLIAEKVGKEIGPVERAQAERWHAGQGSPGQRQIADVGQYEIGLAVGKKTGFCTDPPRPVGMSLAIGGSAGGQVDVGGIDHHITKIAAGFDQLEGHMNALHQ